MNAYVKIVLLLSFCGFANAKARDLGIFAAAPVPDVPECQADLETVFSGLKNNELWAVKILDASTKIPSGLLTGHLVDFGNFDECLEEDHNLTMQYCFARFSTNKSARAMKWAYCLPKSCPSTFLESTLQSFATDLNVSVRSEDCQVRNKEHLTVEDYVGISLWGIFIGLAVLSTIYDVHSEKKSSKSSILTSFSLYSNGIRMLNTKTSNEDISAVYGLRFLSICWVILGHRCFFTFSSSLINLTNYLMELNEIKAQVFVQSVLAVDTFFLLSGLLNCYHLLKLMDETNRFPIGKYYIHRYIRLTPALAAVILMYATWYPLIGNGPAWVEMTLQWKQLCIDNWWTTILYINNYYNPTSQCAGQSWYLAVDMQLYWLSPIVILPLWKWPKRGEALLWVLFIASVAAVFAIAFVYEFRRAFNFDLENLDEFLASTRIIYVPTHARATPYIMGLLLGYYLRRHRKEPIRLIPKNFLSIGWTLTTMICLAVIFGNYQFTRPLSDHPYDRLESSMYIALHRVGWGFGMSWIIFCCSLNSAGLVNIILSWKAFVPLSRLTYSIFLSHMAIQQYQIGTARTSDYFQYFNQIHRYFGDLVFSVILALVFTLVFESPIIMLEKSIVKKASSENVEREAANVNGSIVAPSSE